MGRSNITRAHSQSMIKFKKAKFVKKRRPFFSIIELDWERFICQTENKLEQDK